MLCCVVVLGGLSGDRLRSGLTLAPVIGPTLGIGHIALTPVIRPPLGVRDIALAPVIRPPLDISDVALAPVIRPALRVGHIALAPVVRPALVFGVDGRSRGETNKAGDDDSGLHDGGCGSGGEKVEL